MEAIHSSVGQPEIQSHTAFLREENNMIYQSYFIARKDTAYDNKENHISSNPK